jgi:hypothetical protein
MDWDAFGCGAQLIEAGESAALVALPDIQKWFWRVEPGVSSYASFQSRAA